MKNLLSVFLVLSLVINLYLYIALVDNGAYTRDTLTRYQKYLEYRDKQTRDLAMKQHMYKMAVNIAYMEGIKAFSKESQEIIVAAVKNDTLAFNNAIKTHQAKLNQMIIKQ